MLSMRTTIALSLATLLCGCSFAEPDEAGSAVSVASRAAEVLGCERVGTAGATTKAKVMGIERDEAKVRDELESLARNEAAKLGGDTILAMSDAVGGDQEFEVYRCRPR